jgi:hypothetical protein
MGGVSVCVSAALCMQSCAHSHAYNYICVVLRVCDRAYIPMRTTISVLCCVYTIARTSPCVHIYIATCERTFKTIRPHLHAQTSNRIFLSTLIIASLSMHTIARIASTHSLDRIASKQIHSRPPAHARAIAPPATVPLATTVPIRPPWNGSLLATVGVLLCGGCRSTRRRQNADPYAPANFLQKSFKHFSPSSKGSLWNPLTF